MPDIFRTVSQIYEEKHHSRRIDSISLADIALKKKKKKLSLLFTSGKCYFEAWVHVFFRVVA